MFPGYILMTLSLKIIFWGAVSSLKYKKHLKNLFMLYTIQIQIKSVGTLANVSMSHFDDT